MPDDPVVTARPLLVQDCEDDFVLGLIACEIVARGKLRGLRTPVRRLLIQTAASDVLNALDQGHEWVGARGGLQFDPDAEDGGWS